MENPKPFTAGISALLLKALCIVLVGAGAGLAYNALSDAGIPLHTPDHLAATEVIGWELHLQGLRATLRDAKRAFDRKNAVFVDARSSYAYAAGHIPGAINYLGNDYAPDVEKMLSDLPRDTEIIAYCSGGSCMNSVKIARLLIEKYGFTRARAFYDGWPAWVSAGYPVQKGDMP